MDGATRGLPPHFFRAEENFSPDPDNEDFKNAQTMWNVVERTVEFFLFPAHWDDTRDRIGQIRFLVAMFVFVVLFLPVTKTLKEIYRGNPDVHSGLLGMLLPSRAVRNSAGEMVQVPVVHMRALLALTYLVLFSIGCGALCFMWPQILTICLILYGGGWIIQKAEVMHRMSPEFMSPLWLARATLAPFWFPIYFSASFRFYDLHPSSPEMAEEHEAAQRRKREATKRGEDELRKREKAMNS